MFVTNKRKWRPRSGIHGLSRPTACKCKYNNTHEIIIGGDLNEDLHETDQNTRRQKALLESLKEHNLIYQTKGKTFVKDIEKLRGDATTKKHWYV